MFSLRLKYTQTQNVHGTGRTFTASMRVKTAEKYCWNKIKCEDVLMV